MRLLDRGTGPKTSARGPRQLPWSRVNYEDWGATARQSQTVGASANPSASRSVGTSLRPPRPSTVTGPGPSRTWPGSASGCKHPAVGLRFVATLLRSVRTFAGPLAALPNGTEAPTGADRDPASPGVRNYRPSTDVSNARPLPHRAALATRPGGSEEPWDRRHHPPASRSDLVVSHHLAGLLRAKDRGLVASRCRSWGSPRFPQPAPTVPAPAPRGC
jgi:hypothetical protein